MIFIFLQFTDLVSNALIQKLIGHFFVDSYDICVAIFSPDFDVIRLELYVVDLGDGRVVATRRPPCADGQVQVDEGVKVRAHSLAPNRRVGAAAIEVPRDGVLPVVGPQQDLLPRGDVNGL